MTAQLRKNRNRRQELQYDPYAVAIKEGQALEELKATLETQVQQRLKRYATLSCRNLCSRMTFRLPRELRDAVYQIILDPPTVHIHQRDYIIIRGQYFSTRYFPNSGSPVSDYLGRQYYWNVEYVGPRMQKELAETWYRTATFGLGFDRYLLEEFLTKDRWGLGIVPKQLITSLVADVDMIESHARGYTVDSMIKRLRLLLGCERGVKLSVTIHNAHSSQNRQAALHEVHSALRTVYATLEPFAASGSRVKVIPIGWRELSLEDAGVPNQDFVMKYAEDFSKVSLPVLCSDALQ